MKIRFIQSYSTSRESFREGDEHDVAAHEAEPMVAAAIAVTVDEKEQPPAVPSPPPPYLYTTPCSNVQPEKEQSKPPRKKGKP